MFEKDQEVENEEGAVGCAVFPGFLADRPGLVPGVRAG